MTRGVNRPAIIGIATGGVAALNSLTMLRNNCSPSALAMTNATASAISPTTRVISRPTHTSRRCGAPGSMYRRYTSFVSTLAAAL